MRNRKVNRALHAVSTTVTPTQTSRIVETITLSSPKATVTRLPVRSKLEWLMHDVMSTPYSA